LRDDRGVSCWGDGETAPVERLPADGGWAEIAVGGVHACARVGDTVQCLDAGMQTVPGAVQLAAGDRFTCARTDGGTVYCWGKNDVGQLGDGKTADSEVPVKVGF
jgi:alpha-tubulin suppressor-like RCC1 family protein